jgi:hypothetical protein
MRMHYGPPSKLRVTYMTEYGYETHDMPFQHRSDAVDEMMRLQERPDVARVAIVEGK